MRHPHSKIDMRRGREVPEWLLGEARARVAPVGGTLRTTRIQRRPAQADPSQGDQAEGHFDGSRSRVTDKAGCAVRDPAERPEQGQLVGGTLLVLEDHLLEQVQGAAVMLGKPDGEIAPREGDAAACAGAALDRCLVVASQTLDLALGHGAPAGRPCPGAGADLDRERPAGPEETDRRSESSWPVPGTDLHQRLPRQDRVEGQSLPDRALQSGNLVVNPADLIGRGAGLPDPERARHRVHGKHVVARTSERDRALAAGRSDIQNRGWSVGRGAFESVIHAFAVRFGAAGSPGCELVRAPLQRACRSEVRSQPPTASFRAARAPCREATAGSRSRQRGPEHRGASLGQIAFQLRLGLAEVPRELLARAADLEH